MDVKVNCYTDKELVSKWCIEFAFSFLFGLDHIYKSSDSHNFSTTLSLLRKGYGFKRNPKS